MLHQLLDILKFIAVHPGIGNKEDAAVYVSGIYKYFSHIAFCNMGKASHLHTANGYFAVAKYNNRMQQQGIAENLHTPGDFPDWHIIWVLSRTKAEEI